jgi:gliding motility-associated lipoprotein GldH
MYSFTNKSFGKFRISNFKFRISHVVYSLLLIAFSSCKHLDVFEKNTPIPKHQWQNNFNATGALDIADTSSLYNIYIVLRHTDSYKYNNIWLNVNVQSKTDTIINQKLDISLATDAIGWEGVAMSDIWEVRKKITAVPFKFRQKDAYQYSLTQLMRDNPLLHVMSAGIRIEKANF